MGLRIQTNTQAINAHRALWTNDIQMAKSLERLSSGYRVNRAADDAAGLSMSMKFVADIRAMGAASRNVSQASSLLQIAEGGEDQIVAMLQRLKELSTQAASANSSANLTDLNTEAQKLLGEIDRIANSTTWQGTVLLNGYGIKSVDKTMTALNCYDFNVDNAADSQYSVAGVDSTGVITIKRISDSVSQSISVSAGSGTYNPSTRGIPFKTSAAFTGTTASAMGVSLDGMPVNIDSITFQVGEKNGSNYQIQFKIDDSRATALSVNAISLSTMSGAQTAMDKVDAALVALSTIRAGIGAAMNRLEYSSSNLAIAIENASAANSVVRDVDMAAEMTTFTKTQILIQAGTAMLAQANSSPQLVLSLFGGR
jgi:flagellin